MSDKIDLIYDLVKGLDEKQNAQTEKLVRLESNVERNSEDLEHHIKRTDLLEESLNAQKKATNERFIKLEEPRTVIKSVGKFVVWVGSISGAIYGIYRVYLIVNPSI